MTVERLVGGVFALVGGLILLAGVGRLVAWGRLRLRAATAVSAARPGAVELVGTATTHETTLPAPFSAGDCLAYTYRVERYDPDDDGSNWDTVSEGSAGVPFLLSDHTGSVLVDPDGAELLFARSHRSEVDNDEEPPPVIGRFLEAETTVEHATGSISLGPLEIATGDRHRFTATRLDPGEPVYVAGEAVSVFDLDARPDGNYSHVVRRPGSRLPSLLRRLVAAPFVVADGDEAVAQRRLLRRGLLNAAFGAAFAAVGLFVLVA
jgi:hypothetical protein